MLDRRHRSRQCAGQPRLAAVVVAAEVVDAEVADASRQWPKLSRPPQ
jgi:hypothetical protein